MFAPGSSVFTADVHLDPRAPETLRDFLCFLDGVGRRPGPSRLFIIGDLFDVWSGKESMGDHRFLPLFAALRGLGAAGVEVTVFRGNRDFLLDAGFERRAGVRLVDEGLDVSLGALRAYLAHGDRLFAGDRAHQRFRAVMRSAPVRSLTAVLPGRWVARVARWLRKKSRDRRPGLAASPEGGAVLDVPSRAAARIFRGGADVLIIGHIHREEHRVLRVDGRDRHLYTLPSWDHGGTALEHDGAAFRFHRLDPRAPCESTDPCRDGSS